MIEFDTKEILIPMYWKEEKLKPMFKILIWICMGLLGIHKGYFVFKKLV